MNEYRILVCGGRKYGRKWNVDGWVANENEVRQFYRVLVEILSRVRRETEANIVIIHGAAKGADDLASRFVKHYRRGSSSTFGNISEEAYPADWKRYPKAAGPIRNRQMLTEGKPHEVIAFPGGVGTKDMITIAKKAGIKVTEVLE